MSNDPVYERWRTWALDEARRRELDEMRVGLELIAKAAARLRAADWNRDASRPGSPESEDDGRH